MVSLSLAEGLVWRWVVVWFVTIGRVLNSRVRVLFASSAFRLGDYELSIGIATSMRDFQTSRVAAMRSSENSRSPSAAFTVTSNGRMESDVGVKRTPTLIFNDSNQARLRFDARRTNAVSASKSESFKTRSLWRVACFENCRASGEK